MWGGCLLQGQAAQWMDVPQRGTRSTQLRLTGVSSMYVTVWGKSSPASWSTAAGCGLWSAAVKWGGDGHSRAQNGGEWSPSSGERRFYTARRCRSKWNCQDFYVLIFSIANALFNSRLFLWAENMQELNNKIQNAKLFRDATVGVVTAGPFRAANHISWGGDSSPWQPK